ncbi:Hypothetical protein CINCED_3A015790 [Cinara cedri]|nr:Hypothetical protein CINCED_3A015790 [Cinara cedri]
MAENTANQTDMNEWVYDFSQDSNNEESLVEELNNTKINNNKVTENIDTEKQENNYDVADSINTQNSWLNQFEPKNHNDNKDKTGFKKRRGGFNKSNNGNNSFENTANYDSTSNHFQSNGVEHIRVRGRGFLKKLARENESGRFEYNVQEGNTAPVYRGRGGRANHRGRGGRLRETSSDSCYENAEEGHNKKENDKPTGSKPVYIPPDIENKELISGIEVGLNFDKYKTIEVKVSGINPPECMSSFHDSGLCDILLKNLSECNFSTPTPIQNYSIPIIIAGRDLMASAQTGSGKTAAYILPILHNLLSEPTELVFDEYHCEPHVVIMAPTRELAIQIFECAWKFSNRTNIRNGVLYGGTSIAHQKSKILQKGVHILAATPGRLNDFVDKHIVSFASVKFFILDEADRMLDMGFKSNIELMINHPTMKSNEKRQTAMFSATFASEIQLLATSYLKSDYIFVSVGEIGGACKDVFQSVIKVTKFNKKEAVLSLLKDMENCQGTIVFVEQKRMADYVAAYLSEMNFPTTSIHGDREQEEREQALHDFKTNKMKVLVATAVAARGLDIKGVNNVVNFDLPKTIDEYVHRIGRTGRLGNAGKAISFFDPDSDSSLASELIRILRQADQEVPTWLKEYAQHTGSTQAFEDFNDIRENAAAPIKEMW